MCLCIHTHHTLFSTRMCFYLFKYWLMLLCIFCLQAGLTKDYSDSTLHRFRVCTLLCASSCIVVLSSFCCSPSYHFYNTLFVTHNDNSHLQSVFSCSPPDFRYLSFSFLQRPGSKNLHHIHAPTEVLHISNIP